MDEIHLNNGNFLELLKLSTNRDSILKQYLNSAFLSSERM